MIRRWGLAGLLVALGLGLAAAGEDDGRKGRDADAFFRKLDANNDGTLSKDEFLKLADRFKDTTRARKRLADAYDALDPQNQGLTREQLRRHLEARNKK